MEYELWNNGPQAPMVGLDLVGPHVESGRPLDVNGRRLACRYSIRTNYVNPCSDCGNQKDCGNWASWDTIFGPVCGTHHAIIQHWLVHVLRDRDAWWAEYVEDTEEPEGTLRSVS